MSGVIAVLGFGEASSLLARDLVAAGAVVRGYDPKAAVPAGVTGTAGDAEAVAGADLVLSVNSASDAEPAFDAALAGLGAGAVWADLNTAAPSVKQRLAAVGRQHGIPVTDVALSRIVTGSRRHAVRRGHEMAAAAEMLTDLGVKPIMATASEQLHERLAAEQSQRAGDAK